MQVPFHHGVGAHPTVAGSNCCIRCPRAVEAPSLCPATPTWAVSTSPANGPPGAASATRLVTTNDRSPGWLLTSSSFKGPPLVARGNDGAATTYPALAQEWEQGGVHRRRAVVAGGENNQGKRVGGGVPTGAARHFRPGVRTVGRVPNQGRQGAGRGARSGMAVGVARLLSTKTNEAVATAARWAVSG